MLRVSTSPVAYNTLAERARLFSDTTSALYHIWSSGQNSCGQRRERRAEGGGCDARAVVSRRCLPAGISRLARRFFQGFAFGKENVRSSFKKKKKKPVSLSPLFHGNGRAVKVVLKWEAKGRVRAYLNLRVVESREAPVRPKNEARGGLLESKGNGGLHLFHARFLRRWLLR